MSRGTSATLGINKKGWNSPSVSDQLLIETATASEFTRSLAQFNTENAKILNVLRANPKIKLIKFNDRLVKVFGKISKEVIADTAAKDTLARKIVDSYLTFLTGSMNWSELSETGYRNTRRLAFNSFRAHRTHPLRPAAVRSPPSGFGPGISPVANLTHHHLRRISVDPGTEPRARYLVHTGPCR